MRGGDRTLSAITFSVIVHIVCGLGVVLEGRVWDRPERGRPLF